MLMESSSQKDNLNQEHDVVIIGAGIYGLATAHYLLNENPDLNCLLIDKMRNICQGNTSKATSMYRDAYSNPINHQLARASILFFQHLQNEEEITVGLERLGYLYLLSREQWKQTEPILNEMTVDHEVYTASDLESKIPELQTSVRGKEDNPCPEELPDIYRGIYYTNCGKLEPSLIANYYFQSFKEKGGAYLFGVKVKRIIVEGKKDYGLRGKPKIWQAAELKGVETSRGTIKCKKLIVTAGAWTPNILDPIGIDVPVKGKKRQVFQIRHPSLKEFLRNPHFNGKSIPFIILPVGSVYIRPNLHHASIWVGCSDNLGRALTRKEDELDNPKVEADFYEYEIHPVLATYVPILEKLKVEHEWAGHHTYNVDKVPFIFRAPELPDIIVSTGGGSGIMKADSIGRITAAVYFGRDEAVLFDGTRFPVKNVGLINRCVNKERMNF